MDENDEPDDGPQNLLVVDWDYFFPSPKLMADGNERQDWMLYDYSSAEHDDGTDMLAHLPDVIWGSRAESFYSFDLELPLTHGWQRFWERFTGLERVPMYYADSNVFSAPQTLLPDDRGPWERIDLYDAHHDSGYREGETHLHCGNWMAAHRLYGTVDLRVHYPAWRGSVNVTGEARPLIEVERSLDDGRPVDVRYSQVFVCRSGAWVPAWCDELFEQFTASYPGPKRLHPDAPQIVRRTLDLEVHRQRSVLLKVARRQNGLETLRELIEQSRTSGQVPDLAGDPEMALALAQATNRSAG